MAYATHESAYSWVPIASENPDRQPSSTSFEHSPPAPVIMPPIIPCESSAMQEAFAFLGSAYATTSGQHWLHSEAMDVCDLNGPTTSKEAFSGEQYLGERHNREPQAYNWSNHLSSRSIRGDLLDPKDPGMKTDADSDVIADLAARMGNLMQDQPNASIVSSSETTDNRWPHHRIDGSNAGLPQATSFATHYHHPAVCVGIFQ
ncbi:hypothetical protein HMN09_00459500 [Mycena chlorophos]|uniref:Uncharacterized protein n=1 Tax=Mycena chlorophos TaxID=658473 RepID=A0A8H6WLY7_MYCCL|nr:hypothetical protein HMN09_00459500 [Mycena chlorophos]